MKETIQHLEKLIILYKNRNITLLFTHVKGDIRDTLNNAEWVKNNYDYNLILGITAFYTIIGLFAVLLVDLSYGLVDPRIRMGARR